MCPVCSFKLIRVLTKLMSAFLVLQMKKAAASVASQTLLISVASSGLPRLAALSVCGHNWPDEDTLAVSNVHVLTLARFAAAMTCEKRVASSSYASHGCSSILLSLAPGQPDHAGMASRGHLAPRDSCSWC